MKQQQTTQPIYDCVIIGGGMSGISFAHGLSRLGHQLLILEKEDLPGGRIQTYRPTALPDFWLEAGAHTCYNSYTHLLSIVKEAGLADQILPLSKGSYLLSSDEGIRSVFSQIALFSLLWHGIRMFGATKEGKSVKEYFRPIVGQKNYDRLFAKMFRAVICQEADDYPAEFFLKRRKERLNDMPRKLSFRGGLSAMVHALVANDELPLRTHTEVIEIYRTAEIYHLHTATGDHFQARAIAIATPPHTAAHLLRAIDPPISEVLQTIPLAHSHTRTVVVERNKVKLPPMGGIISLDDAFLSAVARDVVAHPTLRGFAFHFPHDVSAPEEQLARICRTLQIRPEEIVAQSATAHLLPSPRKEHARLGEKIDALRGDTPLFLLGNYYYGLSLEDCAHRAADECARYQRIYRR